jgi:ADP-heptose:LPS heptosyltransferase
MPEKCNLIKEGKWIPLLSVSRFLDITPENPVVTDPYIHSSVELNARWKEILCKEDVPIVGINWQGNPKAEKSTLKGRSIPLEMFSILTENHNFKFLSLQKGFGSEQLETCSFKDRFVDCQNQVNETWDFLETASIIANCDLVITIDTYVAHLAAGMGKPTWCLLKFVPDWRWGMHGETTFWYPSMKLFRQKERNNWEEVLEEVSMELKLLISKK